MDKKFTKFILAGAAIISVNGFAYSQSSVIKPSKFINPANMDLSVKPGDDFYKYASGNWLKKNPVPAKETRWGSFNELRDFNINALKSLLQEASTQKNTVKGSVTQRVGDLYASAMDSTAIEKLGYAPIKADLARIDKISSIDGVLQEAATQRTTGSGSPLFSLFIGQDRKNVTKNVVQLGQGGTTLPDRDYYLKDDVRSKGLREAYIKYISTLFTLSGDASNAAKNAATILSIETTLAKAQMGRVEMRDPYKTYNKLTVADFSKSTPAFNWDSLIPKYGIPKQDTLLVSSPAFFSAANDLLKNTSLEDWKVYLKWNILKGAASSLSSPFVKANFDYTQVMSGQKVMTPRWQRMSQLVDGAMGELLGQLYVDKHFKPAAKERMKQLVENLQVTFAERINNLDWMSAETKVKALRKLNAFTKKIGFPDKWKTYEGVTIDRNDFYGNLKRISKWSYNDMVGQLGKPVDKTRWGMTPPTVNAYYSPVNNEIVFPAGILQFPFFDFGADDAVNYGGIGAVIGHEMTHGFDDSGSQYDADGTLRNWWTKVDADKFKAKAQQVVEQYNGYTVLDTIHVNGKLTLGENLADLGGLNIAYAAFKKTAEGKSNKKIDGFTPDQRFFLSWAQVWRSNTLPETAAQLIITDPHSPGQSRTIGPIVNMEAWYKAFDVKPGDKLYKPDSERIKVW